RPFPAVGRETGSPAGEECCGHGTPACARLEGVSAAVVLVSRRFSVLVFPRWGGPVGGPRCLRAAAEPPQSRTKASYARRPGETQMRFTLQCVSDPTGVSDGRVEKPGWGCGHQFGRRGPRGGDTATGTRVSWKAEPGIPHLVVFRDGVAR